LVAHHCSVRPLARRHARWRLRRCKRGAVVTRRVGRGSDRGYLPTHGVQRHGVAARGRSRSMMMNWTAIHEMSLVRRVRHGRHDDTIIHRWATNHAATRTAAHRLCTVGHSFHRLIPRKQVCVQLPTCRGLRRHCRLLPAAGAAVDRYLLGPQQQIYSSGFAAVSPCWDRLTDTAPFHRTCSASYAGSANNAYKMLIRIHIETRQNEDRPTFRTYGSLEY